MNNISKKHNKKLLFLLLLLIPIAVVIPLIVWNCSKPKSSDILPIAISLDKHDITIDVGQSQKITANITPDNATNKNISWSTNNNNISISEDGVVTGLTEGESILTAKTINNLTDTCNVKIINPETKLESISFKTYPQLEFSVKQSFNYNGLELYAHYSNKETKTITSGYTIDLNDGYVFKETDIGKRTINVTYQGKTTSYDINISKESVTLIEISVLKSQKQKWFITDYYYVSTGLQLTAKYSDGSTKTITSGFSTNYDTNKFENPGDIDVTIIYSSKIATHKVKVLDSMHYMAAVVNGEVKLNVSIDTTYKPTFSYITNSSEFIDANWKTISYSGTSYVEFDNEIVLFKGNNPNGLSSDPWGGYVTDFIFEPLISENIGQIEIYGSALRLINENGTVINPSANAFSMLFKSSTSLTKVSDNFLNFEIASEWCCYEMFYKCSNLIKAPKLPATQLNGYCYRELFRACSSLKIAPALPSTNLAYQCYDSMFQSCSKLSTLTKPKGAEYYLPATTLADYCYYQMFEGCALTKNDIVLPAKELKPRCYGKMFIYCRQLEIPPIIECESISTMSCHLMFGWCEKLKITTDSTKKLFFKCPSVLAEKSVYQMFYNTSGSYCDDPQAGESYYYEA